MKYELFVIDVDSISNWVGGNPELEKLSSEGWRICHVMEVYKPRNNTACRVILQKEINDGAPTQ